MMMEREGERERGLMEEVEVEVEEEEEEEEKEMKLHLFWWLTNDFEMRVDLPRRQNHFPNNTV